MIRPFRAWRYAPQFHLDDVLAPPYDVISPAERQDLAERHAQNIVRFILPQPGDGPEMNAYEHAAQTLKDWRNQGVLRQDLEPAIYLLRQTFLLPDGRSAERSGFMARLRLAPWGQGILPHERTFPQAKADRLALLKASGVQDSPIFALFQDAEGQIQQLLAAAQTSPPTAVFTDAKSVRHELWVAATPDLCSQLTALMSTRTIYIADGHHRYETALNFQEWRRQQDGNPAEEQPYDFCLAYFASMDNPGTVILPTHRLIIRGRQPDPDQLLADLAADFEIAPFADDRALIAAITAQPAGSPVFGLIADGMGPHLLRLRSHPAHSQRLLAEHTPAVADLPVAILQSFVLGPYFHISADPATQKAQLYFEPNPNVTVDHVRHHRASAAFLTTATSMAQLRAVAESGSVAPPKATYFYPKLPSGLVLNQIGD